jgi:hypothetical protein
MDAALGFRAHTGWAASVAVGAGPAGPPAVIERRRIDLAGTREVEEAQVFHRAADLALPAARVLIERARSEALRRAVAGIDSVCAEIGAAGHRVVALGVVLGSGAVPDELAAILRSHPLIHTAEGELYRAALMEAGTARGLSVTGVAAKELSAQAMLALGVEPDDLRRQLVEMGRGIGKPWAQDQKESALVAWLALAAARRGGRRRSQPGRHA